MNAFQVQHNLLNWVDASGIPHRVWDDPAVEFSKGAIRGSYDYSEWLERRLPIFGEPDSVVSQRQPPKRPDGSNRRADDYEGVLNFILRDGQLIFQTYYTHSGHHIDKFPALAVLTPDEFIVFGVYNFQMAAAALDKDPLDMTIGEMRSRFPLLMRSNVYINPEGEVAFAPLFSSYRRLISSTLELAPAHLAKAGAVLIRKLCQRFPERAPLIESVTYSARAFEVQSILKELNYDQKDPRLDFDAIMHRAKHVKLSYEMTTTFKNILSYIEQDFPQMTFDDSELTRMLQSFNSEALARTREVLQTYLTSQFSREAPFLRDVPADWK